jgi:hypothetical protein
VSWPRAAQAHANSGRRADLHRYLARPHTPIGVTRSGKQNVTGHRALAAPDQLSAAIRTRKSCFTLIVAECQIEPDRMNIHDHQVTGMPASAADRARSPTSLRQPLVCGGIGSRADHRVVLRPDGAEVAARDRGSLFGLAGCSLRTWLTWLITWA